jgi:hypothetical protein
MTINPALGRQRLENYEFKACLGYKTLSNKKEKKMPKGL